MMYRNRGSIALNNDTALRPLSTKNYWIDKADAAPSVKRRRLKKVSRWLSTTITRLAKSEASSVPIVTTE
jgi:hypothetical protein